MNKKDILIDDLDKHIVIFIESKDENGDLWVYGVKPERREKDGQWWDPDNGLLPFSGLFQFIKWEDKEPYLIKDLLEEESIK